MFSIKSSKFSNCFNCKLLDSPSCILETNCEKDLRKIDLLIVAENPGKEEIKNEIPLIGKSGKTFRKYFNKYLKDKCNFLITNVVLCQTIDSEGKTSNPDDETINNCKHNLLNIIDICKPKLILTMGASPLKAFDIKRPKITDIRGKIFKWNNYNILPTLHPSYVNRKKYDKSIEEKFENDIILSGQYLEIIKKENKKINNYNFKKGIQYYSIPEKYYTNKYRLVDVQYSSKRNQVLYIFRDENNVKEYYWTDANYYCYQTDENTENRLIVPYDKLNQININYKDRFSLDSTITYEGDIKIEDKSVIDYSIKNKEEAPVKDLNILYFDIETDTAGSKEFPSADEAKYPICLITSRHHNQTTTYVLNNGTKLNDFNDVIIKSFDNERDMLKTFIEDLHESDISIITGWSVINFDLSYIYNRLPKLGLDQNILSPFEDCYINGQNDYASIVGYSVVDMLEIYKGFQLVKRENYKLGTIAQIEVGATKLQLEESYSTIYKNDLNKYIEYNIVDVELLNKIEQKTKYIELLINLRNICSCSIKSCGKPFGRLDCLIVKDLKTKNLASRNAQEKNKENFVGAFVKTPIKGLHNYLVDLDFTSLYPNIIKTLNLGINTFCMTFENILYGYDLIYDIDNLPDKFIMIVDPLFRNEKIEYTKEQLLKEIKDKNLIHTINGCFYKSHKEELSFYSEIIDYLLKTRKIYKKKMLEAESKNDEENINFNNIRQLAFKVLANSLYGVLGLNIFRFFDINLSTSVTMSGQMAIKTSILNADKFIENIKNNKNEDINIIVPKQYMYSNEMNIETPNIITSDTDSLFAKFDRIIPLKEDKEKAFKKISNYCNIISDFLNNNIIINMVKKHNVLPENNELNLKNELICSRGLFISKKHYVLQVKFQEGYPVDKRIVMGLEIKRRDFSQYTKQTLSELIDLILNSDKISFNTINKFIKIKEKKFYDRFQNGDKIVSKPVNFTKRLEEYKSFGTNKKFPESIEGMLNWNLLEYECFFSGVGGYLFKLDGVDLSKAPKHVIENYNKHFLNIGRKLNVIVIPDEEFKLPSYYIINMNESMRYALFDRVNLLLEPVIEMNKKVLTF